MALDLTILTRFPKRVFDAIIPSDNPTEGIKDDFFVPAEKSRKKSVIAT